MKNTNKKLIANSREKIDILLSFGASEELDTSLDKLITFQIAKYNNNINQIRSDYALWTGKCENLSKYKHTRSLSLDGQVFVNSMAYIYLKINRLQILKHQV